ncbi:hypothetical protein EI94DRAFT_1727752 [Lactarius quietus]|nr:hypothetical protein EI94DRAFT_1727752 [Lactarius quietus]
MIDTKPCRRDVPVTCKPAGTIWWPDVHGAHAARGRSAAPLRWSPATSRRTRFADASALALAPRSASAREGFKGTRPLGLEGLVTYKKVPRSEGAERRVLGKVGSEQGKRQYYTHQPIRRTDTSAILNTSGGKSCGVYV